jgi:hypothetical protein
MHFLEQLVAIGSREAEPTAVKLVNAILLKHAKQARIFHHHKKHKVRRFMQTLSIRNFNMIGNAGTGAQRTSAGIGCILLFLSGCALEPNRIDTSGPPQPRVVTVQTASPVDKLMALIIDARKLSQSDLTAERDRARAEYNADKSDINRVRLAVLLSLPNSAAGAASLTPANVDDEIITLVDPVAFNGVSAVTSPEPEVRALALLLQGLAQDRKRWRELARESQSKAQAAPRKDELTASQQEARNLRIKIEELEKQLAEYKKIGVTPRASERSDAAPK